MPPHLASAETSRCAPAGTPRVLAAIARIVRGDSLTTETISHDPHPLQRASRRRPPHRPSPPCSAPATLVGHREEAITGSAGLRGRPAESAPGTRGRRGASCSRFDSRTSCIASRSLAADSHPGPGAGWGRGLLARPAPTLADPETGIPLMGGRMQVGSGAGEHLLGSLRPSDSKPSNRR
ncbi:hypothetical protein NN561_016788 [Cricetulus griseus]